MSRAVVLALSRPQVEFLIEQLDYLSYLYEQAESAHAGESPSIDSDPDVRQELTRAILSLRDTLI